ncbi:MAG: response regulator transcription factor [Planctomycetes bacterium]|nr:response regulator transcription factor [Planctomycetota bacterium]
MRVLVVEDEPKLGAFLQRGLSEAGFDVHHTPNGDEGYELAQTKPWDAIVLDIMLPGRDGLSILTQLRKQRNAVPVILLTARSELDERLEGLGLGADDYLTKPFFLEELIARIHALIRRLSRDQLSVLEVGPIKLNLLTRELEIEAQAVELTTREFSLLEYLCRSPGRILSRTQIYERVWGYDFDPRTNLVDVYVGRLRKKLGVAADYLETVRGVGYRLRKE